MRRRTCYAGRDPLNKICMDILDHTAKEAGPDPAHHNQFGIPVRHTSTIRKWTEITAERDARGNYWAVSRTAGVTVTKVPAQSEAQARERFERMVEEHYAQ